MIILYSPLHLFTHTFRCINYIAFGLLLVLSTSCTTHYPSNVSIIDENQSVYKDTVQHLLPAPAVVRQQPVMQTQTNQINSTSPRIDINTVADPTVTMGTQTRLAPEPINSRLNIAEYNQTLFHASEQGDIDLINQMIEQGANVSATNTKGETALHSAAAHNQVDAAMILIEKGADVGAKTISGWTPLHSAARFGAVDVINLLMGTGSKPHLMNHDGKSAVDLARQAGHDSAVRTLLVR